ncbi:transcriptional regulator GcvA [Pseudomonas sp. RIT-PI-AD]|uniref:transcriptional regulator GcvA n=1 Tax=Pseudomonas sp. RIT-PI-AD TaxID=3035294 RepID=UPI0021DAB000|nr:transcriptional regulator GcvA [Pseudomonas sp. RIT-PI-AD]
MTSPKRRLPSLNALRAFEAAARHLNFRLAAEELGVTQGAVAQQVRGLELDLGLKLFDRLPRSLALTGSGRAYCADIARAFEILAEATGRLRPEPRRMTISVTPTFASKWLIPRLPDFMARHPSLDLHILATERLSNFQADGVDIAVRYGKPPFGPGLHAELLFEQEIIAVCSPLLLETLGVPRRVEALERFILLHDTHNFWPEFIERVLGGTSSFSTKGVRFSQTSHAIEAAIAGQGITLATRFFLTQDLQEGRLVRVYAESLRGNSDFYVVTPRHRRSGPVEQVMNWLLETQSRFDDRGPG